MFGSLMKYEFKATGRVFLPLFGAMLIMSVLSRLLIGLQMKVPQVISITLSIMLIAAAFVMTLILTIQRFYKNLLTGEGYLMFTLPVTTDRLIWSKLLVAAVWTIVCAVAVFLSIAIMAATNIDFSSAWQEISQLQLPSLHETLFVLEFGLLVLVGLLDSILMIYASMSLSLYVNKHRVAASFGAYIALNTLLQILGAVALMLFANTDLMNNESLRTFFSTHALGTVHGMFILAIAGMAAIGAGLYAITRYMLKNQLNLQ